MPFFDLDFDIQVFEIEIVDAPDFVEADLDDTADHAEDITDVLSLHSDNAPGGKIAWDDGGKDAFVFSTSTPGSGNTTGGSDQQTPDVKFYSSVSASSSSTSSTVG